LAADADAVADRLAAAEDQVEIRVLRIDDDGARRLVGRIVHGRPPEVGPNLVAVVGRSVAETEPTKRIGGCLGGEGARGNDNGGERRKAAQLVHDWLPFPCPISRPRGRQGSKLAEKNLPLGDRALVYGGPKPIEWRGGRRLVGQKEVPAVGDLTAG